MQILFYLFAAISIISALFVVGARSPINSVIALIVCFLSIAGHYILLNAQFLAAVHIIVYTGAIMVLFLFVIMLVNLHRLQESRLFASTAPLAAVVGALLVGLIVWALAQAPRAVPTVAASASLRSIAGATAGNSEAVAWVLFKDYLVPFEIASVFLLVAMIGAVVLGRKG